MLTSLAKGVHVAEKEVIRTDRAPGPFQGAPYNQAIRVGDLVFVAGQLGTSLETGALAGAGVAEQTEQILAKHAPEVHAVAQALLDRNDLTGKQCIEVIRAAAVHEDAFDSELLLKSLVDETIVSGKNGNNGNGTSEKKSKPKRKAAPKLKAVNK